ncbi:acetyl-CoA synthetase-like protein [Sistotremastrum niveocremeum HHB9708]|uniref:Acetyl-CoA synthetase-like protein n=1 Tax=Sistotremastrum niveocremeum HHB9708 TaxID=1314777 RepID=A0A164R1F5_9AGAM|nr:acetyl-CoA synthetase-like protein [Sistotremastrum niveocremeum HHB9708]
MSFKLLSHIRDIPVAELFIGTGTLNPDRIFAKVMNGDIANLPVEEVAWKTLLEHAHAVAIDLAKEISPRAPGSPARAISILASHGYNFIVHMLAAMFNGWTVLMISQKNSPAAIDHLIEASKSECILIDQGSRFQIQSCLSTIPILEFRDVSSLQRYGLPASRVLSPEELALELETPAIYAHTSGSTGHPKIVPWTHRFFSQAVDAYVPDAEGFKGHLLYCLGPIYHAMGTLMDLAAAPVLGCPILLVHSNRPLTGEGFLRYLDPFSEVIVTAIPSVLEEVAEAGPESMKKLASKVKAIFWGGANLDRAAGEALTAHGVPLVMAYGMCVFRTEINAGSRFRVPDHILAHDEWRYVQWRNGYKYHMVDMQDGTGAKELIISPDVDTPAVINHENPRGFRTKDLWIEHPQRPGWWRHAGRTDDITVLSNGEKTNNKQLETILLRDPLIEHAIVFGQGRSQNGIIVNPSRGASDPSSFLNQIWPTIEILNKEVPMHSRIVRELIIIASPNRPFALTDKGTVRTKVTIALYEKEIEAAYKALSDAQQSDWDLPSTFDFTGIQEFLRNVLRGTLGHDVREDDDFFSQGMDSLLAVRVRSALLPLIKQSAVPDLSLPRNIIYTFPTINSLTTFLVDSLSLSSHHNQRSEHDKVYDTIAKYSKNFPARITDASLASAAGLFVAVTGTTGSVGSFLLAQLLEHADVRMVYCLNRKSSKPTTERQREGLADRGLDPLMLEQNAQRIQFLDVELSDARLGLSTDVYEKLRANVTHIIHSAWQLNFNMVLDSFEKVHVAGVRHLIDLALRSPRVKCPRLVFLSSIATVSQYNSGGKVPETPFEDASITKMGYGVSKFVGERIVVNAVNAAGLNGTVVRIGQISGATIGTGAWSTSEHIPILLKSSVAIGMVPGDLPDPRWIPADVTAHVIISLSFNPAAKALDYFHLENPDVTPWENICLVLRSHGSREIHSVPMKDWITEVRRRSQDPNFNAADIPASRLLEFFETEASIPVLDVAESLKVAPELRIGSIPPSLIEKYLDYLGL